jgi:hypothetical protein
MGIINANPNGFDKMPLVISKQSSSGFGLI